MKLTSEQQHLSALRLGLESEDVSLYKACISVACNGLRLPEEDGLGAQEKQLLEVRRLLHAAKFDEAEKILQTVSSTSVLLNGDRLFLCGMVHHRRGEQKFGRKYMEYAAAEYRKLGDFHRELRARVNGALFTSSLDSVLVGDLYCLELEARRQGFSDIVANITRTRATELLIAGKFEEALLQAKDSADHYSKDGFQDDRAVALLLAAIAARLLGKHEEASAQRAQALILDGKVKVYLEAYEAIVEGRKPEIPAGHSLERMVWPRLTQKKNSVTAKIIAALSDGALTKEELIDVVYAPAEYNESYVRRIYSAINQIRKEKLAEITFNGKEYELQG